MGCEDGDAGNLEPQIIPDAAAEANRKGESEFESELGKKEVCQTR
jgi:hypothetical protein